MIENSFVFLFDASIIKSKFRNHWFNFVDGQFVLTHTANVVSEPVDIIGDERGNLGPLRKYNGQDVFVNLNQGSTLNDYTGFAIYCAKYKLDFGHVFFPPANRAAPAFSLMSAKVNMKDAKKLGSFLTLGHNVSGDVYALDDTTLLIKNFVYDGTSNGEWYFLHFQGERHSRYQNF